MRFYAARIENGMFVIYGEYLTVEVANAMPGRGAIRIVDSLDDLPGMYGGGCDVLSLSWSDDAAEARPSCNGP